MGWYDGMVSDVPEYEYVGGIGPVVVELVDEGVQQRVPLGVRAGQRARLVLQLRVGADAERVREVRGADRVAHVYYHAFAVVQ